jgi:hypothetical protein
MVIEDDNMTPEEIEGEYQRVCRMVNTLEYRECLRFRKRLCSLFGRSMTFRELKIWEYRIFGNRDIQ